MKYNIPKDWYLSSSQITANCECGNIVPLEYEGEVYEGYIGNCPKCKTVHEISAYALEAMDEYEDKGPQMKGILYLNDKVILTIESDEEYLINYMEKYITNSDGKSEYRYEIKTLD